MIKLIVGDKEKNFTNKAGIIILQKSNPDEKFRIALCKQTNKRVIQNWHKTDKEWMCLHD
jgi:hypothetical protein